ncbi:MAG: hypothetical protein COB35_02965 [Gammaproteobacteria bacterium]|nr:MAG: hypothetical protein COB35_02965 [Gammaproteobacteria bacterium]
MLFFRSLLCKLGFDDRLRFFIINFIGYFSFLLTHSVSDSKILSLIILFASAYFSAMSALRRLHDAQLKTNWLVLSIACYLVIGLAIIFVSASIINWLIILPLTLSALLLTYSSNGNKQYNLGYNGPVDLSHYKSADIHTHHAKIEPSFVVSEQKKLDPSLNKSVNSTVENIDYNNTQFNASAIAAPQTTQKNQGIDTSDLGETIRHILLKHKKTLLLAVSFFIVIIFTAIYTTSSPTTEISQHQQASISNIQQNQSLIFERSAQLDMPDNFTLFLNQYNGLIIHWQADEPSVNQFWSLVNAQGDDSCQQISFNKGEKFRTLTVSVENKINHYASFSPLDTQKLLQAIAFRGSFSLCDFKFSLKGSQAALNKNSRYADFIEY